MNIKENGSENITEESENFFNNSKVAERKAVTLGLAVNHAYAVAAAARS